METSLNDELIGRQVGSYTIERLLGVGGMARVYRARDLLLGREVAVKALAPAFLLDSGYVERFRREAQRVAALDHPHIAPLLHFIEEGSGLYLVMPLYAESLGERIEREKRLTVGEATRIVSEIGSALAAAHAHGLIHRDVKPGNILLDEQGKAFLCDFGIARQASFKGNPDTLTLAGSGLPVGTPQYMPPEQLRGHDLDQRTDIYALGVVLYEMLTGRTPHIGNSPFEVAAAALTEPVVPPSRRNPAITPQVEAVILRSLNARKEDRYANVKSFVEALQAAEQGQLPDAATRIVPAPAWGATRRSDQAAPAALGQGKSRRWWLTVGLITVAMILALGGGAVLLSIRAAGPGGGQPRRVDGVGVATGTSGAIASATASAAASATASVGGSTQGTSTPGAGSGTPTAGVNETATASPSATAAPPSATATAVSPPTATPAPPPLLTLGALHLVSTHGNQCTGSQSIYNGSAQTITWQWETTQPALPLSFVYGVNTSAQFGGLPADLYPGLAPGATDTLNVQMRCSGQSYTVTLRDSFGRAQQFTMISD